MERWPDPAARKWMRGLLGFKSCLLVGKLLDLSEFSFLFGKIEKILFTSLLKGYL